MAEHRNYEPLRETHRQVDEALNRPPPTPDPPPNPYEPLHETHREVAAAEAAKPPKYTELEWAEIALERDAARIAQLKAEGKVRPSDIIDLERRLQNEPLDEKIRRTKYEEERAKEVERGLIYLESTLSKPSEPSSSNKNEDEPTHPDREMTDARAAKHAKHAQLRKEHEKFESTQKWREASHEHETGGRDI